MREQGVASGFILQTYHQQSVLIWFSCHGNVLLQLVQLRVAALIAGKTKEGRELQEVSIQKLLQHARHISVGQLLHQRAGWALPIQLVMVICIVGRQLQTHESPAQLSKLHVGSSMASGCGSKQPPEPQQHTQSSPVNAICYKRW